MVLIVQYYGSPCNKRLKSNSIPSQISYPLAKVRTSSWAQIGTSQIVCSTSLTNGTTMNFISVTLGWSLNIPIQVCIARRIGDTKTYFAFKQWTADLFASHYMLPIGCKGVSITSGLFISETNSSESSPYFFLITIEW